jgi:hypothetical protein
MGGVGDGGSIGGVERACFNAAVGGEALGLATLAADRPDVVGIEEGDPILA